MSFENTNLKSSVKAQPHIHVKVNILTTKELGETASC